MSSLSLNLLFDEGLERSTDGTHAPQLREEVVGLPRQPLRREVWLRTRAYRRTAPLPPPTPFFVRRP